MDILKTLSYLPIRVFYCGVIFFHKYSLNKLHCLWRKKKEAVWITIKQFYSMAAAVDCKSVKINFMHQQSDLIQEQCNFGG